MIFLTVGTQFSFDRLVKAVDELVGANGVDEEIFAQIGKSSYRPRHFEAASELEKGVFDEYFGRADGIISHAGMGTITMALERKKPLLVMPRLRRYGEVVNDHQVAIARKFEELHYLLVAYDEADLPVKIEELKTFAPRERRPQTERVVARISAFLNELSELEGLSTKP
jgi:UDP-N-acetylglucosamine transferase subunit ALG13